LGTIKFDDSNVDSFMINQNEIHVISTASNDRKTYYEIFLIKHDLEFKIEKKCSYEVDPPTVDSQRTDYVSPDIFRCSELTIASIYGGFFSNRDYFRISDQMLNTEFKPIDLSRFGTRIKSIINSKDDVYIFSENIAKNSLYQIHLGDEAPTATQPAPLPTLTQTALFAARKWFRYSFHIIVFECISGAILNPSFSKVKITCVKITLFLLLYPIMVIHDALMFLMLAGKVIKRRNLDDFVLPDYEYRSLAPNQLPRCRLSNKFIRSPAHMSGSDILYEERELEDFIIKQGRDPEGNPCTPANIIPDTILRYRIRAAI
jgi:hypothetical protein